MYYDIYILESKGTCVYHQQFSELKDRRVGPDLISGFFSAMCLFSKELINKKPEIMEIEDVRLVFSESNDYIFVAIIDENESIAQVQDILNKISLKFFQNYGRYLEKWDRDVEVFRGFEKQVELIIIKVDIDRIMLIEKLENLLELKDDKIDGILILTSRGDAMLSSITNEKYKQYIVKLIENNWRSGIHSKQMIIRMNDQYVLIEELSDFLMGAILMQNHIEINRSREVCKVLFKNLREQVKIKIEGAPEI
ncbi:MAG: hypothetical protein HWN67_23415 [Candidatus Helarchaeota archaeon]|nr:hypothetical protein [Candidatus Helarchaeota archaeon]